MDEVRFRAACHADAAAVAELHADSWRRHYRGAYADTFLDGDVAGDRLQVWDARLAEPREDTRTILAEADGRLVGFVHVVLDADARWGALLDNVHVAGAWQRHGIGARLLGQAAAFVSDQRPSSGLYLWVLEQNVAAQRFYRAVGGSPADAGSVPAVGGVPGRLEGSPRRIRFVWSSGQLPGGGGARVGP